MKIVKTIGIYSCYVPFLGLCWICIMKVIWEYGHKNKKITDINYNEIKNTLNKMFNFNLDLSLTFGIAILFFLLYL